MLILFQDDFGGEFPRAGPPGGGGGGGGGHQMEVSLIVLYAKSDRPEVEPSLYICPSLYYASLA